MRFRRRFGWTARLEAHERVWLTFAGTSGTAEVWLNGQRLGPHERASEPFEFEVARLLRARNELVLEVESESVRGEVAVEVRCTAYLRQVRAWTTGSGETGNLYVEGEVVGACERPLELYLLHAGVTVAYRTIEATAEGQAFRMVAEGIRSVESTRLELVNGATVWFAWES
jgi:hypothetical protein